MLNRIRVTNPYRSDLSELSLTIPGNNNGYKVVFIDGLGPVSAELSSTPYANLPGEYYQSSRVTKRNIVMTLELAPSYSTGETVEDLRKRLYGYFSPQSTAEMIFETTTGDKKITGIVESFEAPLFVKLPRVQISIICHDPFFTKLLYSSYNSGSVSNSAFVNVTNSGDVPIGMSGTVSQNTVASANRGFVMGHSTLLYVPEDHQLSIDYILGPLSAVAFDTTPGNKSLNKPGLDTEDLLHYLEMGSRWPLLYPGPNSMFFQFNTSVSSNTISLQWVERYVGL